MKRLAMGVAAAALFASAVARAEPAPPARVVVAGPPDDAIAARTEQELRAVGFDPVRVDAADGCSRASVLAHMEEAHATAAACSDGSSIGVWTSDARGARIRDVVVARGTDTHDRDVAAVRAAEVVRASVELPDDPPPPARQEPSAATELPIEPRTAETVDLRTAKPAPTAPPTYTATFIGASGISALLGADAKVPAIDAKIDVGVSRYASLAFRFAYPTNAATATRETAAQLGSTTTSVVQVRPGIAGAGVDVPLARPSSFIVPRVGGGFALVWLQAQGVAVLGGPSSSPTSETATSPAMYADATMSMRVYGPMRVALDGMIGATASRLVARANGTKVAYWGQPFGAFGAHVEVQVP